eukprot:CAMPEP_0172911824 /NCGR_PEP_ID=MMETSP1075-20121228/187312_1 /TAXON_ID=2916 /ORGANISM="Ceratium fusus, Strain PA161109" /LENGTH=359 /DNA_ID=CAMNT_0013770209 /DNA_START=123 /DNA_END=1200 /DNA_ORIENTATION=+
MAAQPQAPAALTNEPDIPDEIRDQYKHLREDMIKVEGAANEAEANGDTAGAKFKMMLLGDVNEKIQEMEEKYPGIQNAPAPKPPETSGTIANQPNAAALHQMLAMFHAGQATPLTLTQQQAMLYDKQKAAERKMEPDVIEFQAQYSLQERHAWSLNEQLKERNNTYDDDLWALHEIMRKCNNTAQRCDLLNMNVRWMKEGKFCGPYSPNPLVIKAAKKYNLDPPSACKLADALEQRDDPDTDMARLDGHLARSNKPSSLVMMMLKTLKNGGNIGEASSPVAIGSYMHKEDPGKKQQKEKIGREAEAERIEAEVRGGEAIAVVVAGVTRVTGEEGGTEMAAVTEEEGGTIAVTGAVGNHG